MLESLIAARTFLAPAASTITPAALAATTALTAPSMTFTATSGSLAPTAAVARARFAPATGFATTLARLLLAPRSRLGRPAAPAPSTFVPRLTASAAAVRLGRGAGS